jgi:hypothetical protein
MRNILDISPLRNILEISPLRNILEASPLIVQTLVWDSVNVIKVINKYLGIELLIMKVTKNVSQGGDL